MLLRRIARTTTSSRRLLTTVYCALAATTRSMPTTLACRAAGLDAAALSAQLLTLEMRGAVEMLPGGLYQRRIN